MIYIDPNKPAENTWLYHIDKLYEALKSGGGDESVARRALELATQALEAANSATQIAQEAKDAAEAVEIPAHTPAQANKTLTVNEDGTLDWTYPTKWS